MKIEKRPISDLIPYVNNSRTHSDKQIDQIAASIQEFGVKDFRFCIENDCYAVDAIGNVYRVCREQRSKSGNLIRKYQTVLLKGSQDRDGYTVYRMMVSGKKKHVKGHRIMLNAWLGPSKGKVANHRNGLKTDNRLENLEWVTIAENNAHAIKTGLWKKTFGINQKVHPSNYVPIYLLIKHAGFSRATVAEMNKVCRQTIDTIFNRVDRLVGHV